MRASPEGVKHMDVLNKRASRALPRAKTGSGAVAMKRQQTLDGHYAQASALPGSRLFVFG